LYRSVGHSCFPPLVAAGRVGGAAVANLARPILGLIIRLAIPATLGAFVLAGDLLVIVYGNNEFRDGAIVFQILAFTLLLDPLNPILGHGLWAMNRDRIVLQIVIVNLITNTAIGLLMISNYGLLGAACTSLISSFVNMSQHYWFFDRHVDRLHFGREILKSAPATLAAIACLALLPIHRYLSLSAALLMFTCLAFYPFDQFSLRSQVSPDTGD
jgi:O-antigen/teichoic acid export membrane protein